MSNQRDKIEKKKESERYTYASSSAALPMFVVRSIVTRGIALPMRGNKLNFLRLCC